MGVIEFRMCRYCGNRIDESNAYCRRGRKMPGGDFCTPGCANGVYGFDDKIERERSGKIVSFDAAKHDSACTQIPSPDQALMAKEDPEPGSCRRFAVPTESEIMDAAEEIDPRLPGILAGIKKGRTQDETARRMKMSPRQVRRVLSELRASLSVQS